ncbi:D-alanyl-D-alanine carboxypeptidase [Microbacterium xanthum]|uniref:D-alanyl-D-alanine carboxypeptidase n=1 Tax=Microbacterium xanthum TaxID=3079794 RepID=UPI002AD47CB6|nr:D-alanyl-D-alanine carboxypeptidase [Microbacterium sp. KSW-48]MDZ8171713.1 D-alanyl-D-alanine carboxypeptidase [Microbacterium sp. KSW-48]
MTTQRESTDALSDFAELMDGAEAPADTARDVHGRRVVGRIVLAIVLVLAVCGLSVGGYAVWALSAPVPAPTAHLRDPVLAAPEAVSIATPTQGAAAVRVTGAEEYLGPEGLEAASGPGDPLPIASITKLVTALVVLDAYPLGDGDPGPTITFGAADHALYDAYYVRGATIAAMPAGSSMSLRNALGTMLIPSASNYAHAVSTWAFGSLPNFLAAAREWLDDNGMTSTTIVDPTGLDPGNVSTTADLLRLGALAAADPTVSALAATPSLTLDATGTLRNTNELLGVDGVTGMKTGNLGNGTFTYLYTASLEVGAGEPLQVVGAVLGGQTRAATSDVALRTLASIRSGFHEVELAEAGTVVGEISTPWGESSAAVVADDVAVLTWSDTPVEVTVHTRTPEQYRAGAVVGSITWTAGPNSASSDIVVAEHIAEPTAWWRLTHPDRLG